ncbi:MAG: hypothetical protein AAF581_10465 [Planctomycetota bacterium]
MNPHSSSTSSSSDTDRSIQPHWREAARVVLWTVAFLVLFDVAIGLTIPGNSLRGGAEFLFNSGLSNERKLRQALASEEGESPLLLDYGWIGDWHDQPSAASDNSHTLVASYGMSFSHRVSQQLPSLDDGIELRLIGGPGAPLNHAFASYLEDRDRHNADVVVLGVLASSLPMLRSMNQLTCTEIPAVYTYPRFFIDDKEQLQAVKPVIATVEEMRSAAHDPEAWQRFVAQLRDHDGYYSPVNFRQDAMDHSAIARVLRRAWGQRHYRQVRAEAYGRDGFDLASETVQVARAIVREFGRTAREDGRTPLVILFDNTSLDNLDRALRPTLEEHAIPFVSSHEIAPSTDPTVFLPDRHFTPEIDRKIAAAALQALGR